jgi:hypothetical protein
MNRAKVVLSSVVLDAQVAAATNAGHNLSREMQCALRRQWGTLLTNEAGWESFRPQLE